MFQTRIGNLTDIGETVEEMNLFDTSVILKTPSPPPKKKSNLFSRLLKSNEKFSSLESSIVGDKRLMVLKSDNRNVSMVSSPSIMMPKKEAASLPSAETSLQDVPGKDKMDLNKSQKLIIMDDDYESLFSHSSEEKKVQEQQPEKKDDEMKPIEETPVVENLPPPAEKEVSLETPKLNFDIIAQLKLSSNNLMQAVEVIKSIK